MTRNLILTFLACGASVMLGGSAQAQTPDTTGTPVTTSTSTSASASASGAPDAYPEGHRRGAGILRHLTEELSLSGTQEAAVAQILEAAKPRMKAIHDKAKADRDALVDSVSSQITPLLTPDQQTKFSEMVDKFKNGPALGEHPGAAAAGPVKHGGPMSPEAQLRRMTAALGLTADQQTQIKPILEAARKQVRSIFANSSLTQARKFAQFKQAMETAHSQINGILTPAQQAQYASLRARPHGKSQGEAPASPSVSGTTST
jgi:Spy/CpxP family protein refolding chaperone